MKFSDWFHPSVKPELQGVYEVAPDGNGPWYSYWDGASWGYMVNEGVDAAVKYQHVMSHRKCKWRGLAEDPNKESK